MDRRQIADIVLLTELEVDLKLDSFDGRLIVQKAIYLAQAVGLNLGYHFSWYLRGPYSANLTRDVFEAVGDANEIEECRKQWFLDRASKRCAALLKTLLRPLVDGAGAGAPESNDRRRQARWLELLASVHFLIERKQVSTHDSTEIEKKLKKYNKDFTSQEIEQAVRTLRKSCVLQE